MKKKILLLLCCFILISCNNDENNKGTIKEQIVNDSAVTVISEEKLEEVIIKDKDLEVNNIINKNTMNKLENKFGTYEFTAEDYERFSNDLNTKIIEGDKEFLEFVYGMSVDDKFIEGSRKFLSMTGNKEFIYSCNNENVCTKGGENGMISGGAQHYYDTKLKMYFRNPFRENSKIQEGKFAVLNLNLSDELVNKENIQVYVNGINLDIDTSNTSASIRLNNLIVKNEGNDVTIKIDTQEIINFDEYTISLNIQFGSGEDIKNIVDFELNKSDLVGNNFIKTISLDELLK